MRNHSIWRSDFDWVRCGERCFFRVHRDKAEALNPPACRQKRAMATEREISSANPWRISFVGRRDERAVLPHHPEPESARPCGEVIKSNTLRTTRRPGAVGVTILPRCRLPPCADWPCEKSSSRQYALPDARVAVQSAQPSSRPTLRRAAVYAINRPQILEQVFLHEAEVWDVRPHWTTGCAYNHDKALNRTNSIRHWRFAHKTAEKNWPASCPF